MCLVHRGGLWFCFFFLASQFHYKGLTRCCKEKKEKEKSNWGSKSPLCVCHNNLWSPLLLSFHWNLFGGGLIRMERQKFPFTIENILKYPSRSGDKRSYGASGLGLKEKTVSPAGGQTEAVHHACLCCCYCSHCADILQPDFIHEGRTIPSAFVCGWAWFCSPNLKSDLLPAACQYGWNPAILSDSCRLGDTHREEQSPSQQRRTRRHRTIFTEEQLDALEELFLQNQYPDVNTREKLAQRTHLREERVEVTLQHHIIVFIKYDGLLIM